MPTLHDRRVNRYGLLLAGVNAMEGCHVLLEPVEQLRHGFQIGLSPIAAQELARHGGERLGCEWIGGWRGE